MTSVQNEIHYSIAWDILKKLLLDGVITKDEYNTAHSLVIEKYRPMTVHRL